MFIETITASGWRINFCPITKSLIEPQDEQPSSKTLNCTSSTKENEILCVKSFFPNGNRQTPLEGSYPIYWITIWFWFIEQSSITVLSMIKFCFFWLRQRSPVRYTRPICSPFYWRPCSHSSMPSLKYLLKFRCRLYPYRHRAQFMKPNALNSKSNSLLNGIQVSASTEI